MFYNDIQEFNDNNLIPIINNLQQLEIWQEYAKSYSKLLPCAIHINTGMNRLGMSEKNLNYIIDNPELLSGLKLLYIISHLSESEIKEGPYNLQQLLKFKHYVSFFPKIKASLANSSCVFLGKEYHFDRSNTPWGSIIWY